VVLTIVGAVLVALLACGAAAWLVIAWRERRNP
jgi:hypothetical protein